MASSNPMLETKESSEASVAGLMRDLCKKLSSGNYVSEWSKELEQQQPGYMEQMKKDMEQIQLSPDMDIETDVPEGELEGLVRLLHRNIEGSNWLEQQTALMSAQDSQDIGDSSQQTERNATDTSLSGAQGGPVTSALNELCTEETRLDIEELDLGVTPAKT